MISQDGQWYLHPDGQVRGGIVMENLIHRGDMPVTIGVFVDPGVLVDVEDPRERENRNVEYDAFDERYVTFLLTEIIPQIKERYAISDDPERWGICGGSSGRSCATTAAWLRPDSFRRVIGCLFSFVQLPGDNRYPADSEHARCAFSSRRATAISAGTSPSGTGWRAACASPRPSPRRVTTSASSSAMAAVAGTTGACCCPTPCPSALG